MINTISALYLLFISFLYPDPDPIKDNKVDFLGMNVDGSAATAGQWILLVLGIVLLVATILLGYKYRKTKKREKSSSMMELK